MAANAGLRCLCFLMLALFSLPAAAQVKRPLAIEPKVIENVSETVTVTVTSNGAFDLSGITRQKVRFRMFFQEIFDNGDVGVGEIVRATKRSLTMTLRIFKRDAQGERLMNIDFGDMIVSLKFTLLPPFVCPNCGPPGKCVNKVCVFPKSTCSPACRAPARCNEVIKRCEIPQ